VVLDECDKMIDMNFEDSLKQIFEYMPSSNVNSDEDENKEENAVHRQTLMFSATMPKSLEVLANSFTRKRIVITIGEGIYFFIKFLVGIAVDKIVQRVEMVEEDSKMNRLIQILNEEEPTILIFVNHKKDTEKLSKFVRKYGFSSDCIHGNKNQENREQAIKGIRDGSIDILVSTDLASRGLDIDGVKLVINYDMPNTITDYVHRIGRTARKGLSGKAISFLKKEDTDIMYDLKKMLERTNSKIPEELLHNENALMKPGTTNVLKKRKDTIIYTNY
jgi:ATP-dependent RNA helicase DDX23/PRP28